MSVLGASLRPIAGSCGRNLLPATRKASRVSSYVRQLSTTRPRSQDVIKPSNKEDELLAKPKAKEDELLVKLSPSLAQIIEDSISVSARTVEEKPHHAFETDFQGYRTHARRAVHAAMLDSSDIGLLFPGRCVRAKGRFHHFARD